MAFVKKYQEGGVSQTPNSQAYKNFIVKKLSEEKFTKKGEQIARSVADNFVKLYENSDFKNIYNFNPVTQEYSIDSDKISDNNLKSLDWSGSKDAINKNIFGQFSGNPDRSNAREPNAETKKYNSLLANWTNEFMSSNQEGLSTPPQNKIGVDKKISNIGEYILKHDYYGNDDLLNSSFKEMASDDDRKAAVIDALKRNVQGYLSDYDQNKNTDKYLDLDLVNKIKESLDTNDWNKIRSSSKALGWDLDQFLIPEKKDDVVTTEGVNKDKTFENGTVSTAFLEKLKATGYDTPVSKINVKLGDKSLDWINDYIKESGATAFKNKEGKIVLVKGDKLFDFTIDDRFHPGYGHSWRNTDEGGMVYNPQSSKNQGFFSEDSYKDQNIGRELIPDTDLGDWKVIGWSDEKGGEYASDVLGRRDFTKHIVLTNNDQKINLERGDDNQYYYKDTNKPFEQQFNFKGYGKGVIDIYDYDKIFPNLRDVPVVGDPKYQETIDFINKNIKSGYDVPKYTLESLKWGLKYDPSVKNNKQLKENILNTLSSIYNTGKYHNGGVLKHQYGGKAFQELVKKSKQSPKEAVAQLNKKVTEGTTIHNFITKPTTENVLDAISIAGDVASFVPGVGAIGAAVTGVADLTKDLMDGDIDDPWKHVANAGFIGLAFVGAGGLKSAAKLAQVASKADKTIDITKAVTKLGEGAKNLEKSKDLLKIGKKLGPAAKESEIIKEIEKYTVKHGEDAGKLLTSDLGKIILSTVPTSKKIISKSIETLDNLGQNGYVKGALAMPTIGAGLVSSWEVGKKLASDDEKAGNITLEDVGNILKAGSLGKNFIKNIQAVKAIKTQTIGTGTENKINFEVGGKKLSITGENLPENKKLGILSNPLARSKNKAKNAEEFKESLATRYNEQNPTNTIQAKDITNVEDKIEKEITKLFLRDKPFIKEGQSIKSAQKNWELAKKAIEGGKSNIQNVRKADKTAIFLNTPKVVKSKTSTPKVVKSKTSKTTKTSKSKSNISDENEEMFQSYLYMKNGGNINKFRQGGNADINKSIDWSKIGKGIKNIGNFVDSTDIANLAMYYNTRRGNKNVINARKQAALASIAPMQGVGQNYMRIADTISPIVNTQATNIMSQAGNIARGVSDIDKANAVRLQGASQASDLIAQNKINAANRLDQLRDRQREINMSTNQHNAAIANENRKNVAQAHSDLNLLDSALYTSQATALNNLITASNTNLQTKLEGKDREKLFQMSQDPEIMAAQKKYNAVKESGETYKKEFDDYLKSDYANKELTWETSPHYKKWTDELTEVEKEISPVLERLRTAQTAYNYGISSNKWKYKSGGTLKDKVAIEELKQENKKEIERLKRAYTTILKNNELMYKSLNKIFK